MVLGERFGCVFEISLVVRLVVVDWWRRFILRLFLPGFAYESRVLFHIKL